MEKLASHYLILVSSLLLPIAGLVLLHNGLGRLFGGSIAQNPLSKGAYMTLGVVGIPLHELSHAIAAVLFRHRIGRIQWVGFGPHGLSGYVEHSWNSRSIYQRVGLFWIGVAPLLTAMVVSVYVVGDTFMSAPIDALEATEWWKLLGIALVSFYCIPSLADLRSAVLGGVALMLVVLLVSTFFDTTMLAWIMSWIHRFTVATAIITVLSVLAWLFFYGLSLVGRWTAGNN